jgi:dGTPase
MRWPYGFVNPPDGPTGKGRIAPKQMTSTILCAPAERPTAAYACQSEQSRGRLTDEPACVIRTPFQRDRDRIIHSSAFRRLTHKTQVFIYHEGDHYRTRLTHSLEVAQVARSLARVLRLDEDLAEAVALAHDLGHPPFGHSGEEAIDHVMHAFGGFDHNAQSLRTVTVLERRYASFDGLNLTWETLEGIAKHNGPLFDANGAPTKRYQSKGVQEFILNYNARHDLELNTFASAEAQTAAIADDIAYNNHDIDDGLRAEFFSIRELSDVPLAGKLIHQLETEHGALPQKRLIYEMNRRMTTVMIHDVLAETARRLATLAPRSAADIRAAKEPVVAFSEGMYKDLRAIRHFLVTQVYRNVRIEKIMDNAKLIVKDLFDYYFERPQELPGDWRPGAEDLPPEERARRVCDFVAGMTDRFAIEAHKRLFDATPQLR